MVSSYVIHVADKFVELPFHVVLRPVSLVFLAIHCVLVADYFVSLAGERVEIALGVAIVSFDGIGLPYRCIVFPNDIVLMPIEEIIASMDIILIPRDIIPIALGLIGSAINFVLIAINCILIASDRIATSTHSIFISFNSIQLCLHVLSNGICDVLVAIQKFEAAGCYDVGVAFDLVLLTVNGIAAAI